ncbi:hypothetical protein ACIRQO_15430 [Streptomyces anulatus]
MTTADIPSETEPETDFAEFTMALAGRGPAIWAPNGVINTGLLTGGQHQRLAPSAEGGAVPRPIRQGPVRAKHVQAARRRFVPPPGFEEALAVRESGIVVLVGEAGTGRETHALNLLALGHEAPVLVQVDGTANLSRWSPRAQGVDGYLVTEPADPFALRAWDLARLEGLLTEAGARLVIVLAEAPGLVGALEDHLAVPVVRHRPPDPRKVFTTHLADGCPDEAVRARLLRTLEPGDLDALLPDGLPPRHAAQAADTLRRLGEAGGPAPGELMRTLAGAEGPESLARAQRDPTLLACLLSLGVYGGLQRAVVMERARELLRLAGPDRMRGPGSYRHPGEAPPPRPPDEVLRILGAHRVSRADDEATDTVSFFWPAVSGPVWESLCRDRADLVPVVHAWLADPGLEEDQIERAGRAVAALAEATSGQSLELLPTLASTPVLPAPRVAARCLATRFRDRAVAQTAADLLDLWSVTPESSFKHAVAYACEEPEGLGDEQALRLLEQLTETLGAGQDDLSVFEAAKGALVRRFDRGDHTTRMTVLHRMRDWARTDATAGLLTACTFPVLARTDFLWWSGRALARAGSAAVAVHLVGHSLNESVAFSSMGDALLTWCAGAAGAKGRSREVARLLDGLVAAREPGFLRWLLAVERGPDTIPGKVPAARALKTWRDNTPAPQAG